MPLLLMSSNLVNVLPVQTVKATRSAVLKRPAVTPLIEAGSYNSSDSRSLNLALITMHNPVAYFH